MAEKDITEKTLEAYNDVFADIINVLLFKGRPLVKEEELQEEDPLSSYKADGKLHAQERDVAKYWSRGLVRIALYGLENQTDIDADMPLRLFSYDGAAYRAQLLSDKEKGSGKGLQRYPVVTLVLYFGYEKRWKRPRTLFECLDIPEELRPYVNDYRINLYEIAYLSDEQVQMFQSDFKIVADYFVQMRKSRDYAASDATIKHVHELLQLMSVMTRDNRFAEVYNADLERGETTMCEVLDRIENRGIQQGIRQGHQQGLQQGIRQGHQQGLQQGIQQGIQQGVNEGMQLISYLLSENRMEDVQRVTTDEAYRDKLLDELLGKRGSERT